MDKLYEFYWADYEDYRPHLFLPLLDQTIERFKTDCVDAINECGDEYIEQETLWVGGDRWIEYAIKTIADKGYRYVRPEKYGLCGGMIIEDNDHHRDDSFCLALTPDMYGKACDKNEQMHKKLIRSNNMANESEVSDE